MSTEREAVLEHLLDRYRYWEKMGAVSSLEQFQDDLNNPAYGFDEEKGPSSNPRAMLYASDLQSMREMFRASQTASAPQPAKEAPQPPPTQEDQMDLAMLELSAHSAVRSLQVQFFACVQTNVDVSFSTPVTPDESMKELVRDVVAPLLVLLGLTKVELTPLDEVGEPVDPDEQLRWLLGEIERNAPLLRFVSLSSRS